MTINHVEMYHIEAPLRNPFYPSWIPGYTQTKQRFTLMRVTTRNGIEGVAAGIAMPDGREGLGKLLADHILGLDPFDSEAVYQSLVEASYLRWRFSWAEAAFYDIRSKAEDMPLWKMLGGTDKPIPCYWSTGSVCTPEVHSKMIKMAQSQGYFGVKLRVKSRTLEEDMRKVTEIRRRVGDDYPIMIDANQAIDWQRRMDRRIPSWGPKRAKSFSMFLEQHNVLWLEEPLGMHMYEELAELRRETSIPLAGGELNAGWYDLRMYLHFGSLDIYQPDVVFYGYTDQLRTLDAVRNKSLVFTPHTWSNGVGLWSNMHTYSLTNRRCPFEFPYELGSWEPEARDCILKEPITPKDGYLEVPQEAGIAVPIDWDKVERFGNKFLSVSSHG